MENNSKGKALQGLPTLKKVIHYMSRSYKSNSTHWTLDAIV